MARINKQGTPTVKPYAKSAIGTTVQDVSTFEGAPAWSRDAKSDLFLLGVTQFQGEDTFYEKAADRDKRFIGLIRQVAAEDPEWLGQFLPWLRKDANIRTASVVGAVEAAAVLAKPDHIGTDIGPARKIIGDTLTRADEAAEALAYWLSTRGRKIPNPIRRGIRDVVERQYTEFNYIKWDSAQNAVRMADVVELTHPRPDATREWKSVLWKYMLDSRRRKTEIPDQLSVLRNREQLLTLTNEEWDQLLTSGEAAEALGQAGMTWEQVSSRGKFTAATWQAMIPNMGYMALLRNLRNFQEAGISDQAVAAVVSRLGDPEEVRRSRQFPYRFLSAYLNATSPQWTLALEQALQHSTQNIPVLDGRTLVLVDTSSSMTSLGLSAKSKISPVMAGALFGVALTLKGGDVDLYGFADGTFQFKVPKGAGALRETERFVRLVGKVGHGTQIARSVKATYKGHDRVVIITDMQTFGPDRGYGWVGDVSDQVPANIPMYAFNMQGYAPAMMETSATRHEMGGLTDKTFTTIKVVEAGQRGRWPWENYG